jgi:hypothetical protein
MRWAPSPTGCRSKKGRSSYISSRSVVHDSPVRRTRSAIETRSGSPTKRCTMRRTRAGLPRLQCRPRAPVTRGAPAVGALSPTSRFVPGCLLGRCLPLPASRAGETRGPPFLWPRWGFVARSARVWFRDKGRRGPEGGSRSPVTADARNEGREEAHRATPRPRTVASCDRSETAPEEPVPAERPWPRAPWGEIPERSPAAVSEDGPQGAIV